MNKGEHELLMKAKIILILKDLQKVTISSNYRLLFTLKWKT